MIFLLHIFCIITLTLILCSSCINLDTNLFYFFFLLIFTCYFITKSCNLELKRNYPAEVKFRKLSRRDNLPRSTGNYSPFAAYLAKSRDRSSGSINYLYLRGHCRTLQPNGGRWTSPPVYSTPWFRNLAMEGKRGKEGNEAPQYDNAITFPVPHSPGSAPNPCFRLPQPPCPLFNRDFAIVLGADCYFARALT
ncbi:hypothetical protein ALC57_06871 [Trachymyrmex cornetzi]|uniref:Uncharacterized protein n=1 Tax=Trachymyrmex cornetzi TaxID=471704 RepID=A0A195E811_9HYME|nr:hypothetical protein ALC57_06871 [Trachymyrmex cornetzi]